MTDIEDRISEATWPPMTGCPDCKRDGHHDSSHNFSCTSGSNCVRTEKRLWAANERLRQLLSEAGSLIGTLRRDDAESYNTRRLSETLRKEYRTLGATIDRIEKVLPTPPQGNDTEGRA